MRYMAQGLSFRRPTADSEINRFLCAPLLRPMSPSSIEHPDDESIEVYVMDRIAEPILRARMKWHLDHCVECQGRVRDLGLYLGAMRAVLREIFAENPSG
jgi:hypothetical protein